MSDLNKVTITWKVTGAVKTSRQLSSTVTFQVLPNPGLYAAMGVDPKYGCVSQALVPTATYHQVVRNLLKKEFGIDIGQKKLPFTVPIQALGLTLTFNIKARYYPPHLIVLTIQLSPCELPLTDLVRFLSPADFDRNFKPISDVAKWTLGLAQSHDHRAFEPAQSFICRPIVHVHNVCPESEFPTFFADHKAEYVGILIRSEASRLAPELVERVLKKNEEHNQKSLTQKLLLDKQGVLYLTSGASDENPSLRPLMRCDELFEIASVFQDLLKQYFSIAQKNPDYADFTLFAIRTWIEKPEVVFAKSVTHRLIWQLLVQEYNLEPHLEDVLGGIDKESLALRYQHYRQSNLEWWSTDGFPEVLIGESQRLSSTEKEQRDREHTVNPDDEPGKGFEDRQGVSAKTSQVSFTAGAEPTDAAWTAAQEQASLQRQLAALRENLLLIEERKTEFVQSTDIPLDLVKDERRVRKQIKDLEDRLSGFK